MHRVFEHPAALAVIEIERHLPGLDDIAGRPPLVGNIRGFRLGRGRCRSTLPRLLFRLDLFRLAFGQEAIGGIATAEDTEEGQRQDDFEHRAAEDALPRIDGLFLGLLVAVGLVELVNLGDELVGAALLIRFARDLATAKQIDDIAL